MTLHDYDLSNQTPASYRTDHNNLNQAVVTNNASSSGISTTYQTMWYADESSDGWMKLRDTGDSAWNHIFLLDQEGGLATFAGDPNGNVSAKYKGQDCLDTSNDLKYFATGTGSSSQATWTQVQSGAISAGLPTGYIEGPPPTWQSATTIRIPAGFRCRDDSDSADIAFSTNHDIDITVSGINGLSTSLTESTSASTGTNYYLYAVRKSTDGTIGGILTNTTSGGVFPSGYDQKRILPIVIRNSSSSDFLNFYVAEGWPWRPKVLWREDITMITGPATLTVSPHLNVVNNGTSTSYTSVDINTLKPDPCSVAIFNFHDAGSASWFVCRESTTNTNIFGHQSPSANAGRSNVEAAIESTAFQYKKASGSGMHIDVMGYVWTGDF